MAFRHEKIAECAHLLGSLEEGLSVLSPEIQSIVRPYLDHYRFVIQQCSDPAEVLTRATQLMNCQADHPILADVFSVQDTHVYNVCLALLKRKEKTRCCVVWAKYWKLDIVQMGDEEWYAMRVKEARNAMEDCEESHRCFYQLHVFILSLWHDLMLQDGVLRQVLAMEVNSLLYHSCTVCSTNKPQHPQLLHDKSEGSSQSDNAHRGGYDTVHLNPLDIGAEDDAITRGVQHDRFRILNASGPGTAHREGELAILVRGSASHNLVIRVAIGNRCIVTIIVASLVGIARHRMKTGSDDGTVQWLLIIRVEQQYLVEIRNHLTFNGNLKELARNGQNRFIASYQI